MGCSYSGELKEPPSRWQLGASWAGFDTDLVFEDEYRPHLRQHAMTLSGTRLFDRGWSLRLAAGAALGGELGTTGYLYGVGPGWQAAVQGAKLWRVADGGKPFVSSSLALAAGRSRLVGDLLDDGSLLASDLRLGTAVGWQIGRVWSPYLSAQLFGGPAWLEADGYRTMGTDTHHYRASVGSSFFIGDVLSVFVDAALLGERGLAVGVSFAL